MLEVRRERTHSVKETQICHSYKEEGILFSKNDHFNNIILQLNLGQIFFNCNKINFPSTIPSEA
jgi:hypothetical protein